MSLSGNLQGMPPEDLLILLERGLKNGVLTIRTGSDVRNLFFKSGDLTGVNSSRAKDKLGAFLLRKTKITPQQFIKYRQIQAKQDVQIGTLLVDSKILSRDELNQILLEQMQSVVFDIVCLSSADFVFEERNLKDSECIINPVKTSTILLEATRCKDEYFRIRSEAFSSEVVYRRRVDTCEEFESEIEKSIWFFLENPQSVGQLIELVNECEFAIISILNKFIDHGIIIRALEEENERKQISAKKTHHLERAHTLRSERAFHDAIRHLQELLKMDETDIESWALITQIEEEIVRDAQKIMGSENVVPKIRHTFSSLQADNFMFTAQEGFLFSRIDGHTNLKTLRYMTGLEMKNLYIILHKFVRMGLIYIDNPNIRNPEVNRLKSKSHR